jgi:hypothetical protein
MAQQYQRILCPRGCPTYRHFNFSDWNTHPGELNEMIEVIDSGEMPPIQYWLFHPGSRLSGAQKQTLVEGLTATLCL